MRFRQVYLLVLVGLTAIAVLSASAGNVGPFNWNWEFGTTSFDTTSMAEQYPSSQFAGHVSEVAHELSRLSLSNSAGDVRLRGSDGDQVEIDYTIRVFADTQELAQEYLDGCHVSSEASDGRMSVRLVEPLSRTPDIRGVFVDYDISVPHGLKLDIDNRFGEVDIAHYNGDVRVANEFEATTVSDVTGNVLLLVEHDRFSVSDVVGDLEVNARHADGVSELDSIDGTVKIDLRHCDNVRLRNVTESIVVSSEFSKLRIDDVDGSADIDSRHSSILGSGIKSAIGIASEFDDIDLSGVTDRINVRARHGKIQIKLFDGPETAGGFSIDARVAYGDIRSDIPLEEDQISHSETRATGVHGSGSIPVSVHAEHTDISLTLDN